MEDPNNKYERSKSIAVLSRISDEKHTLFEEVIRLAENLPSKKLYLDIGTGPGDIFLPITHYFENSIGIEPAQAMFKLLMTKSVHPGVKLHKISWQNFYKLTDLRNFDLITCIHSMYKLDNLEEEIKNMLNLLSDSGRLVLVGVARGDYPDPLREIRQKLVIKDRSKETLYQKVTDLFPNISTEKIITCRYKFRNIKELEKNPDTEESKDTNLFLHFLMNRWYYELSFEERKFVKDTLKPYLQKDGFYLTEKKHRFFELKKK